MSPKFYCCVQAEIVLLMLLLCVRNQKALPVRKYYCLLCKEHDVHLFLMFSYYDETLELVFHILH